ncbi:mitochondrial carrier [Exidia glandulosa HHB12029]|uniref:Mitochondrial carrier n=1 Tax=Exidia glandulosa HHB12029 TaxID=1314781 RepID=A0A165CH99_EXIGL|nr:mitochondrial carrier [Exidia glandulosa HHB12029]
MSKPQVTQLTPFGHALAGALGGVFSNAVVYPLDTAKTRIQATPTKAGRRQQSMASILLKILREEGPAGYYRGFFASMLNTFSTQYAYFFFYSFVRTAYLKRLAARSKSLQIGTAAELLLGAVAGALAQIFTIPVSVIATRQQIGHSLQEKQESDVVEKVKQQDATPADESFLAVARQIIREEGVTGLWLGLKPSLVLTVNPAITYGAFERIKSLLVGNQNQKLSPWTAFALGALSKTLATVVTYPYIMAKIRVQARSDRETSLPGNSGEVAPSHGAVDILRSVLKEQGPLGWYQGMGAQITKAVLSQALLFMSKDQFELYALRLMTVWARLST